MNLLSTSDSLKIFGLWIRRVLVMNLIYLLFMSVFRLASLWLYNPQTPWNEDLLRALWIGLRFDATLLGYLLSLPALFLIGALQSRRRVFFESFRKWAGPYYLVTLALIGILLALDIKYYSYFQDHLNILVFAMFEDDTAALLRTFWKNYPVLWYFFFTALAVWTLARGLRYTFRPLPEFTTTSPVPFAVLPLVSVVLLVFTFFMGRGSFGLFPLGPADTVISKDPFINHLTSNGVHALYRAIKLRRQQNDQWDNNLKYFGYSDPKQAFADFYQIPPSAVPDSPLKLFHHKTAKNPWAEKTKPHVIVFVMESFGSYWLRYHSPEFNLLGDLEKHFQQDHVLLNFLPSASSTVGSLSSLMISSPHRPIGNFLTESEYLQVPFRSSPARIYSRAGYETHFVYGGNPGWRDMNKFAKFQGFDHVEGDVDIQAKIGALKEQHDWGVYDEDVFRYVNALLKDATRPQMILVMTTTNHPPYQVPSTFHAPEQKIPPELKSRLVGDPQVVKNRFITYNYSSQKLSDFLTDLKKSPFADKTLVAVTGDHNFWLVNFGDDELMQKWAVPFYLYAPPAVKVNLPSETFGSHMDIFPTLYQLSLSETEYDSLGVSLLDATAPHYAYNSAMLIVGPQGGVHLSGKSDPNYFNWQGHFEKLVPAPEDADKKAMFIRYKSLMSLLDFYFMTEKKTERRTGP